MNKPIIVSKRQKEILISISRGYTTQEMAQKYHISTHTVSQHRRKLIEKFNVSNSNALIRAGFEKGILTMPRS